MRGATRAGPALQAPRALHELADELLRTAAGDIAAIEHQSVRLGFEEPMGAREPDIGLPPAGTPRQRNLSGRL